VRYANLTAAKRECPLSMGWVFISQVDRREIIGERKRPAGFYGDPRIRGEPAGRCGKESPLAAGVAYEEQMQ
jgi:hypothetical protein